MKRIDGPGAGPGNSWTGGNPATSTPATQLRADWFNVVQEELAQIVEAAGLTCDQSGENDAQILQALGLLTGARPGLLNLLINGDFAIWQRDGTGAGVSVAVTSAAGRKYTADRWWGTADGSVAGTGQLTVAQVAHTIGQTEVPGNPQYFCRLTQASASSVGPPTFGQCIEDVTRLALKQVTVSAWVKGSAAFNASVILTNKFGTGGSADVQAGAQVWAITTSWQRLTWTITMPSISGKTIGPGHCVQVHLQLPQGSTFELNISDFQVEPSAVASTFDRRPFSVELALCKRYYQKSWAVDTPIRTVTELGASQGILPSNCSPNDRVWQLNTRFPVEMRTTPTVTWYDVHSTAAAGKITTYEPTATLHTVTATLQSSPTCTGYPVTDFTAGSGAYHAQAHWQADAEL